jgi:ribose/xylose/arabinose/galactoside ABC-type transport system permease subunit
VAGFFSKASTLLKRYRHELGLLLTIFVCMVITTIADKDHNYWNNPGDCAVQIIRQTSMLGIFALGAAIVIIAGGIDLSAGAVIAFGGSICTVLMLILDRAHMESQTQVHFWVLPVAIIGTLLVGFLIGSLHVWLITVIGLPPFVATLATLVGLRSLAWSLVSYVNKNNPMISFSDSRFRYLAQSVWIPAVVFLVLAFGAWVLLNCTVTGRHLYAVGGNEQAARLSGIRTDRIKWLAYCLSAMLSSLAGVFYVADLSSVDPNSLGKGYELNAIAASVVGGCSLQGGTGSVPGAALGALFMQIVLDGIGKVIKVNASMFEGMVVGLVLVTAVALNRPRTGAARTKFFPGLLGLVNILNLVLLAGALSALMGPSFLGKWSTNIGPNALGWVGGVTALIVLTMVRLADARERKLSAPTSNTTA